MDIWRSNTKLARMSVIHELIEQYFLDVTFCHDLSITDDALNINRTLVSYRVILFLSNFV